MTSKSLSELIDSDVLPKSWDRKRLDEIAYINQKTSNLREFSSINYTDISSVGTRTVEIPSKIDIADAPSRARRVLSKGDTVISTVRPNRKSFFYFAGGWENAIASTGFAVVSPMHLEDSEYLHAILTSEIAVRFYESICEGGAYPAFNPSRLAELVVPWPPKGTRTELGKTVMDLQLKIEINYALSKTLEEIAQTIFRSWFIDFDPVKAKMAGEKPVGMDAATAALFPETMEESELGLIPKGWEACQLNSVLKLHKSTVKAGTATESVPYVPIDQIGSRDIFLKNSMPGSEAKTSLVSFEKNEILFGAMRPYFHKVVLAPFKGTTRTTTFVLGVINPKYLSYSLLTVYQDNAVAYATNHSQGTTIPYAVWNNSFENYPIVLPSESIAKAFNDLVLPLIEFGYSLLTENRKLVQIRDGLLPRLISGELQIPEELLVG